MVGPSITVQTKVPKNINTEIVMPKIDIDRIHNLKRIRLLQDLGFCRTIYVSTCFRCSYRYAFKCDMLDGDPFKEGMTEMHPKCPQIGTIEYFSHRYHNSANKYYKLIWKRNSCMFCDVKIKVRLK
jgi:hypothetical protein